MIESIEGVDIGAHFTGNFAIGGGLLHFDEHFVSRFFGSLLSRS